MVSMGTIFRAFGNKLKGLVVDNMTIDIARQVVREGEEAISDGRVSVANAKGRRDVTASNVENLRSSVAELENAVVALYADDNVENDYQAAKALMPRIKQIQTDELPPLLRQLEMQEQTYQSLKARLGQIEAKVSEARRRVRQLEAEAIEAAELNASADALEEMDQVLGDGVDASIDSLADQTSASVIAARARFDSVVSGSTPAPEQTAEEVMANAWMTNRLAELKAKAAAQKAGADEGAPTEE